MLIDLYKNIINESDGKVPIIDIEMQQLFKKYGYNYMSNDTDIKSIKITDKEGIFDVTTVSKAGKEVTQKTKKMGGLLTKLFPGVDVVGDKYTQKMINELRTLTNKIELKEDFEVHNNIIDWYRKLKEIDKHAFHSCVTGREQLMDAIDDDPNVQIVIMKDKKTGKPKGRALLWHHVQNKDTRELNSYLERCYPNNDEYVKNEYTKWAKLKGYWYRTYQGATDIDNIAGKKAGIRFMLEKPFKEIEFLPYMDTFRNVWLSEKLGKLIVTNYKTKSSKWWSDNEKGIDLASPGKTAKDFRKINNWVDDRREEPQRRPDPPHNPDAQHMGDCHWCDRAVYDDQDFFDVNCNGATELCCRNCYDDIGFYCESCGDTYCRDESITINRGTDDSRSICTYCADDATDITRCNWCSYKFDDEHIHETDKGNYVCDYCVRRRYARRNIYAAKCETCGDIIEIDIRQHKEDRKIHKFLDSKQPDYIHVCKSCYDGNPDKYVKLRKM